VDAASGRSSRTPRNRWLAHAVTRQISVSASIANEGALRLYRRLGYRDADLPPKRVQGTIMVRTGPLEVDDTLLFLIKDIAG
jgi:hypothetical protein